MAIPPPQVCPLDGYDDDVTVMPNPEGGWLFSCSAHDEVYSWVVPEHNASFLGRDGITAELGLYDDLPTCVLDNEPWVEYGIVEFRYMHLRPDIYFRELLPRYGHRAQGPRQFSLSAFVAKALGQLSKEGILALQVGPATGFWVYNGTVSYWAQPPGPNIENRMTWNQYATDEGLDPTDWALSPPD